MHVEEWCQVCSRHPPDDWMSIKMSHKHHVLEYVATLPTGVQLQTTSWLWRTRWFVRSRHAHNHRDYKRCQPPDTNFHSRAAATPVGLWWHSPTFWTTLRDFGTKNGFDWWYHPWVSQFLGIQQVNHVPRPPGELFVETILERRVVWFLETWRMQQFRLRNLYLPIHPPRLGPHENFGSVWSHYISTFVTLSIITSGQAVWDHSSTFAIFCRNLCKFQVSIPTRTTCHPMNGFGGFGHEMGSPKSIAVASRKDAPTDTARRRRQRGAHSGGLSFWVSDWIMIS